MELSILFGVFAFLLLIGTPIAFCLGAASLATIIYMDLPAAVIFQQMNSGMNAFAMMAIPFFIYAGDLMIRGGIADRNIAACAGCHSPNGAGIPAQYPRIAGQHADYTIAQLTGFRDGVRKNSVQMTQVAAKLNDREIRAVSDYAAGLR